jgi:hypothetical protein
MIFLLTSVRSEIVQMKTSFLLSRNLNNFISSSGERFCAISTVLSGTLGSSTTRFVSHLASIVVLPAL